MICAHHSNVHTNTQSLTMLVMSCWLCKNSNDDDDERERNETSTKKHTVPHDFNFRRFYTRNYFWKRWREKRDRITDWLAEIPSTLKYWSHSTLYCSRLIQSQTMKVRYTIKIWEFSYLMKNDEQITKLGGLAGLTQIVLFHQIWWKIDVGCAIRLNMNRISFWHLTVDRAVFVCLAVCACVCVYCVCVECFL